MNLSSPFPGIEPYLEGGKWPVAHHKLATIICELVTPLLSPKYLALIKINTVKDNASNSELGTTQ